jgi:hypothetical protein
MQPVSRDELHLLITTLPDGALESARHYLRMIQVWPPAPIEFPPQGELQRKRIDELRHKFLKHKGGSGGYYFDQRNKSFASFTDSEQNPDTGEMTVRTFRVHNDFPMEITERFRMVDGDQTLEYEYHVKGLDKEHSFVLKFEAPR